MQDEVTPPRRCKICIICSCECKEVHDKEKMKLFTKHLIKEFLTPSQVTYLSGLKNFDFCINCCKGILEDLVHLQRSLDFIQENIKQHNLNDDKQLQTSLKFILNGIKQKKVEMKIKILISSCSIHDKDSESFRKFVTRDFCPRVQMKKGDYIDVPPLPNSSENKSNYCIDSNGKDLQKSISKKEGRSPRLTEQVMTLTFESENVSSTELHSTKMKAKYNDNKIQSEGISIQPKRMLPFVVQETVTKFEPWNDLHIEDNYNDYDEFVEYREEGESIHYFDDSESIDDGKNRQRTEIRGVNDENGEMDKFPLTISQLCVLAIMTSENMQMSIDNINDFITDNFPHFKYMGANLGKCLKNALYRRKCRHLIVLNRNRYKIVKSDNELLADLKFLNYKLNEDLVSFMAFPERLLVFKKAIRSKIPNGDEKDLDSEQQVEGGTNFGEIFNCVETDENVVKIEHCVYAIENDDSLPHIPPQIKEPSRKRKQENSARPYTTTDKSISKSIDLNYDKNCSLIRKRQKIWPESLLSYNHMCILAILNSSRLFVTVTDAQQFITENFPFYASDVLQLQNEIERVLTQPPFTKHEYQEDFGDDQLSYQTFDNYTMKTVYAIEKCKVAHLLKQKIVKKLNLDKNVISMAYPERIPTFIENLAKNTCTIFGKISPKRKRRTNPKRTGDNERRQDLRKSFNNLKKIIPKISKYKNYSKILILKQAELYIQQLESLEKELVQQKSCTNNKNCLLLAKLEKTNREKPEQIIKT